MSKKYKYISNNGLAFDEDKIIERLSDLSSEGWFLIETKVFYYKLEKRNPQKRIYSMDYKSINSETKDEYFEIFKGGGWKHVCSYGPYHFFDADEGTTPIYTDNESYIEKYSESKNSYLSAFKVSGLSLLILIILQITLFKNIEDNMWNMIIFILEAIAAGIMFPSLMVSIAYYKKLKNYRE